MRRLISPSWWCGLSLAVACAEKTPDGGDTSGSIPSGDSGSVAEAGDEGDGDAGPDTGAPGEDGGTGGEGDGADDGGDGGGSDDGGSADGGSADGGSADGGSTDGDDGTGDVGGDESGDGDDDSGGSSSGGGSTGGSSSGGGSTGGSSSGGGSTGGSSSGGGSTGGSSSGGGSTGGGTGSSATDSDGDGQLDSDELAAGTDPYDYYDRTYSGGYNVATCGASVPVASTPSGTWNGSATTYAVGDVVSNFVLFDQHGEAVDLYSFCDNHVMLVFSAMWCGSCASVAGQAQSKQTAYASRGFQYLEVLVEDRSGMSVSQSELGQWASSFSISSLPVLDDSARTEHVYYEQNWGYPTIVHLEAGTMQVLDLDAGTTSPSGWL